MGRARNPARDKAFELWRKSNGTALLKDIAAEIGVSSSTIRKWKSQDSWEGDTKRSAPKKIKERSEKLKGNRNARGNSGGAAPKGNKNAVTHGFYANWLPDETREIIESMDEQSPADLIWNSIQMQYAAIIRAQKLMYVKDRDDLSNEVSGVTDGTVSGETYSIQYAWDKQANFMAAQSRTLSVLNNLIKQFVALTPDDDERRTKIKTMQAAAKRAQAEADIVQAKADAIKNGNKSQEDRLSVLLDKVAEGVTKDKE